MSKTLVEACPDCGTLYSRPWVGMKIIACTCCDKIFVVDGVRPSKVSA